MKRYRDVERRLAELECRSAWQHPDPERAVVVDVAQVLEVLVECGVLPAPEDSPDEAAHADAIIAELEQWRRTNAL